MSVKQIELGARATPILREVDVAVIGGSLAGVAAALELAKRQLSVLVVEPRTYLGREMTATLRPWIRLDAGETPKLLAAWVGEDDYREDAGEAALKPDAIKLRLEDALLNAGVEVLFASLPVGIHERNGRFDGIVIGNKAGRQLIRCGASIDATESAVVARIGNARFEPPVQRPTYFRTLEFTQVSLGDRSPIQVPEDLNVVGNEVRVHQGYLGTDHVWVEFGEK